MKKVAPIDQSWPLGDLIVARPWLIGDQEQAIAALLHDTVEDQGGLGTLETI